MVEPVMMPARAAGVSGVEVRRRWSWSAGDVGGFDGGGRRVGVGVVVVEGVGHGGGLGWTGAGSLPVWPERSGIACRWWRRACEVGGKVGDAEIMGRRRYKSVRGAKTMLER